MILRELQALSRASETPRVAGRKHRDRWARSQRWCGEHTVHVGFGVGVVTAAFVDFTIPR